MLDLYTQLAYITTAVFVELPPFERVRDHYLDDEQYCLLQQTLLANPSAGDVIPGAGGLRKLRFQDKRRGKGRRGGLRVIYYFRDMQGQFWLFTVYDKDEASDLTSAQRRALAQRLESEIKARSMA